MSFEPLNLGAPILAVLKKCGYTKPTPIQLAAIPKAIAHHDLIATAQTGTGKTAAFLLPIMHRLTAQPKKAPLPRILILVPTRELANQVTDAIAPYGKDLKIFTVTLLGGMPYHAQLRQLSRPNDIIVATPGRLMDYMKRGKVNLSAIEILVLDEADRMLDMGFIEDVEYIAAKTPKNRQTLLFTATMDSRLTKLAHKILREPERIEIRGKSITLEKTEQRLYVTDSAAHKEQLLEHILVAEKIDKAMIFTSTKRGAEKLAVELRDMGHEASALHGDLSQHKRNKIITQFRQDKIKLLVATDVASRGIHIDNVTHVINYDMPQFAEDYVHRIGRTGRAGKSGIAISLVTHREARALKKIEKYTGQMIPKKTIPGLEPKASPSESKPYAKKFKPHGFSKKDTHQKFSNHKKFKPKKKFSSSAGFKKKK